MMTNLFWYSSFDEARSFVENRIKESPEIECGIRNFDGSFIEVFDKQGVRKPMKIVMEELITKPEYQRWKFWKRRFW